MKAAASRGFNGHAAPAPAAAAAAASSSSSAGAGSGPNTTPGTTTTGAFPCPPLTLGESHAGRVLVGTCGWSDATLVKCKRFYPPGAKGGDQLLRHYAGVFPNVEVDTSAYSIPWRDHVAKWLAATPKGFVFHVKCFGLFTNLNIATGAIPAFIRKTLTPVQQAKAQIKLNELTTEQQTAIWQLQNNSFGQIYEHNKLGVVIFQFQLSFAPSDANRAHIAHCRRQLDPRFAMAVEFRNRSWFDEKSGNGTATAAFLASQGCGLVAADELAHETFTPDQGLLAGRTAQVLPIALHVTTPAFFYLRVHRREGTARLLSTAEHDGWAARLATHVLPYVKGPIFALFGTDHEDQSILNLRALDKALVRYAAAHPNGAAAPASPALSLGSTASAPGAAAAAAGSAGGAPDAQPTSQPTTFTPPAPALPAGAAAASSSAAVPLTPPAAGAAGVGLSPAVMHYTATWKASKKAYGGGASKLFGATAAAPAAAGAPASSAGAVSAAGAGASGAAPASSPNKAHEKYKPRASMKTFFGAAQSPAAAAASSSASGSGSDASGEAAADAQAAAGPAPSQADAGASQASDASASGSSGSGNWSDHSASFMDDRPTLSQMPGALLLTQSSMPPLEAGSQRPAAAAAASPARAAAPAAAARPAQAAAAPRTTPGGPVHIPSEPVRLPGAAAGRPAAAAAAAAAPPARAGAGAGAGSKRKEAGAAAGAPGQPGIASFFAKKSKPNS